MVSKPLTKKCRNHAQSPGKFSPRWQLSLAVSVFLLAALAAMLVVYASVIWNRTEPKVYTYLPDDTQSSIEESHQGPEPPKAEEVEETEQTSDATPRGHLQISESEIRAVIGPNLFDYSLYDTIEVNGKKLLLQRKWNWSWNRKTAIDTDKNSHFTDTYKFEKRFPRNLWNYSDYLDPVTVERWQTKGTFDANLNSLFRDEERQFMYCGIAKTGSTTLKTFLVWYTHNQTDTSVSDALNAVGSSIVWQYVAGNFPQIPNVKAYERFTVPSVVPTHRTYSNSKSYISFVVLRDPLKRLVSGFNNKCLHIDSKSPSRCRPALDVNDEGEIVRKYEDDVESFEYWLTDRIAYRVETMGWEQVNQHWRQQIYFCGLFDLVDTYDYILTYNKATFMNDVEVIIKKIEESYQQRLYGKVKRSFKMQKYLDSSLSAAKRNGFKTNRDTLTEEAEIEFLRKFYRKKEILMLALKLYAFDYQLLPIEAPLWIRDL